MINLPVTIVGDSFQNAWFDVVKGLIVSHWDIRNLVVHIRNPVLFDENTNNLVDRFAVTNGLLRPRHVAYTIFPQGLYRDGHDANYVFDSYNRPNGIYERLHRKKKDWGTYFRRMTYYETKNGAIVNQLGNIIGAFRDRKNVSKAAFALVIQYPGGETIRPLGGPCLNYLAVQAEPEPFTIGLMAVYRNHDFLKRAYGNYWGLCNLINFIANEVGAAIGPLTCISSHAYVDGGKVALRAFVEST